MAQLSDDDEDAYAEVRNPYVMIAGISEYKHENYKSLPGVKVDVKNMKTLWRDIAKYPNVHIITEDLKKQNIQMFEFEKWINKWTAWITLFGEEKGIDGILFVFSG